MTSPNIEFLINSSIEDIISDVSYFFKELIQEIKTYLNLDLVFPNIEITYIKTLNNHDFDISNYGVNKAYNGESLNISIFSSFEKYVRIILLREAYKCFVPIELQSNDTVNIFINQKVELDLQKSDFIKDWEDFWRKNFISYDILEAELDRLEKWLEQESLGDRPSPFQFFFSYIRKNIQLIGDIEQDFYEIIFAEYLRRYNIYPIEIVETISIITNIFYNVKNFRSLLDYKQYFKEFKEKGKINTTFSLRQFLEQMKWIKNYSTIAPSFQVNWPVLDVVSGLCILEFHPGVETAEIFRIMKHLPFFNLSRYSKNSFGLEILGYIFIPKIYMKDFFNSINNLEVNGYLIKNETYIFNKTGYTANLNCYIIGSLILNQNRRDYRTEYELEFTLDYGQGNFNLTLGLLDWLLLDRIRWYSITGLGFERRSDILKSLKSDLLNEVESQRNLIDEIKKSLTTIHRSQILKKKLLDLINTNESYGFFFIKQILSDYLTVFDLVSDILKSNPSIDNYFRFQELVEKQGISNAIEDNIMVNKLKMSTLKDFISLFFKSEGKFNNVIEEYRNFYNLFKTFNDLKLFNLKSIKAIIKNKSLIQTIFHSKEEKLKTSYESYKAYKITNQIVEQRLEDYISNNPPIIKPCLLNTLGMSPFTKDFITVIFKDTNETRDGIEKIKWAFPRVQIVEMQDYKTLSGYIYLEIQMPKLIAREKYLLFSILYYLFKDNIVNCKSYLYNVSSELYSRKDFYDFESDNFFYTKDLFKQFHLYAQKTFSLGNPEIIEPCNVIFENIWSKKKLISHLINHVEDRLSKEHNDLTYNNLNSLIGYHKNLSINLVDVNKFKASKNEYFFKNYIKSIKFIPAFQFFGMGKYHLYFFPIDISKIDFKHLLHNSFQKIKIPPIISKSTPFLIEFLWPYRNPNNKLLNWLVKSKKVIQEYLLFFTKKIFQIFHIDYNLNVNEWDLDPNHFKIYFQNILFNPNYNFTINKIKEFRIGEQNILDFFAPESLEFETLTSIYSWKSSDIKSFLGTRNYTTVNRIIELLEKNLIFPYISPKNLKLAIKLYIILPNVKKDHNEKLLKIFSFFNFGFIHEIEGEYYIYGFPEEIRFENGLMIKLYLPDCQLDEFEKLFDLIFEYLGINHYIILNDLVNGKNLLKSIYGNLEFLKSYNPLKNLIWNSKDKIWMNHKLFDGNFNKIYPELIEKG